MKEIKRSEEFPCISGDIRKIIYDNLEVDDSKFNIKLNLACGHDYLPNYINLDGDTSIKADVYAELDDADVKIPLDDGVIKFTYASHILEHIWYLPQLKKEILRITRPEGVLVVVVPHYLSPDAWGDDTHCRAFSPSSFHGLFWPGWELKKYAEFDVGAQAGMPWPRKWIGAALKKLKGEKE